MKISREAILVAVFLGTLTIGVQVQKQFGSKLVFGGMVAASLGLTYLYGPKGTFFRRINGTADFTIPALGCSLVGLSSIASGSTTSILKCFLLIATFVLVGSRLSGVKTVNLLTGLFLFALIEVPFLLWTRTEWNPNALCGHMMIAGLCIITGCLAFKEIPFRRLLLLAAIGLVVYAGYRYQSRTATLAFLVVITTYAMISLGRVDYRAIRYVAIIGVLGAYIFSGDVIGGLTSFAIRNLDNENVIARFFLEDKNVRNLEEDLLDRQFVWTVAMDATLANPFLGIGYDQSLPPIDGREFRAHNGYLEISYQCGILAAILWATFYYRMLSYSASLIPQCHSPARHIFRPVVFLAFTTTAYLMLAGLMESSGILSLGTPANWIAIVCYAHLRCQ